LEERYPHPVAARTRQGISVLRVRDPWPRIFLAAARPYPPSPEVLRAFGELPPGQALVFEGPFTDAKPEGIARIVHYAPERVEVEATLDREGLLVLNDLHARGWSVTVDGAEAKLLRANVLVRAVRLAAGTHRVVFSYRVPGLALGAAVSIATLSLLLLGAGAALFLGRRRPVSGP
jgi:hypothetical protein